jgi:hypothetical protein
VSVSDIEVTGRDRALLRAIASGRCEFGTRCEPLLLVDGIVCADTSAGHRLVTAGLVAEPDKARPFAAAELTPEGRALIG